MALCCDFLALRLSLCGQAGEPFDFEARRAALLQRHDAVLLHLLESIEAYYYALLGRTDAVPEVFREHRLASVSYFALCRPMMEMIELQVWLAQGQAVKVLARCEELLAACQRFHYGLVALHVRMQMAAAYGLWRPVCRGPGCSGAGAGRGRAGWLLDAAGRKLPLSGPAAGAGAAGAVPSRWWSGRSLWGSGTRPGAPSSTARQTARPLPPH